MALSKIRNDSLADTAVHGRRNLLYNGKAQINQRGAISAGATNTYFADRWQQIQNGTEARSALDTSTDVPSGQGFNKSLKVDVSTADTTLGGTDYMILRQMLEGQDLTQIKKGTSSAEKLTISFWVKSSVTGTHIIELYDLDNARQISKTYTISTADTWQKKVITYPADTSGAFTYDNSTALAVQFWLLAGGDFQSGTLNDTAWAASTNANRVVGQVNVFASTSNNFFLTGVQLELGDKATPFEHRSYGEELRLAQRYYCELECHIEDHASAGLQYQNGSQDWPVTMRATPTITLSGTRTSNVASTNSYDADKNGHRIEIASSAAGRYYHFDCLAKADAEL